MNAGTYGEYRLGAGQGVKDLVGIFVGTGVGGGLIVDGKLRSGFRHAAAEVEHKEKVPLGRIELPRTAPEAGALSAELQGHNFSLPPKGFFGKKLQF